MNQNSQRLLQLGVVAFVVIVFGTIFHWTINRVYVPAGHSLKLTYKGPLFFGSAKSPPPTRLARYEEGEVGVQERLLGPGRHFYCPIWWKTEVVKDYVVEPVVPRAGKIEHVVCQVGIATSKIGDITGDTSNVVIDGDLGETNSRGILRKTFGPGRYRINPFAYDFKVVDVVTDDRSGQRKFGGWVDIPTGYCGVVTNLTNIPAKGANEPAQLAGVQSNVLQPGLYPINPHEQAIDIIEIGYREKSVTVSKKVDREGNVVIDDAGEPIVAEKTTGINFPSNDGFPIHMDFTAIWGILPEQAANLVEIYGSVAKAEERLVLPQIESICRERGSTKGAVELLVGDTRQQFQDDVSKMFHEIMEKNNVTLLYGLVRHIYIPT
ncbi:MAG: band 7 protein, partial [Planctomycetaceae bacterium]|nr:band 7 protein [Planctomycetaceae bacterium]